jgi:hypothetical protein
MQFLPCAISLLDVMSDCIGKVVYRSLMSHAVVVVHRSHHLRLWHVVAHLMGVVSLMIEPHGSVKVMIIITPTGYIKSERPLLK